jgi:hypothetical protein
VSFLIHPFQIGKTRLSAGSGLNAVDRSPSFDGFIFARLPVDDFRDNLEAGFNLKVERSFVRKDNFNDVVIGRERQLDFGNDLALCRWKLLDALLRFGFGTLRDSHESPRDR